MRKKIYIMLAVIFAAILLRFLYSAFGTHMNQKKMMANMTPPVTIATVKEVQKQKTYEIPARVTAKYQIQVNARIDGYLTKSYFKEGDYVKAGQVIFEIEPQEYQLAVERARAELTRVKAQQVYYDKQAMRAQQLVKKDYIAKSEYDNAVSQRDAFRAQTASAEMVYRDALRNLSYTKVKAPVSGRVGIINVTVGNYVTMNSGALTTIYSTKPMYVTFPLDMSQYSTLAEIDGANANRKVEYIFSNGDKYVHSGVQDFRDNKVDETTGTIKMRATFTNDDDALIAGDFGRIVIYSNNLAAVPAILTKTIQENQEGKYVYLLDKDNLPKLTYIKIIGHENDYTLIESGLNVGDRVIDSGIQKVIPGMPVRIISQENYDRAQQHDNKIGFMKKIFRKIFRGGR